MAASLLLTAAMPAVAAPIRAGVPAVAQAGTAASSLGPVAPAAPAGAGAPAATIVPAVPFLQSVAGQGLSLLVTWAPNPVGDQVGSYAVTATPASGSSSPSCPAPAAQEVPLVAASDTSVVVGQVCAGVVYTVTVAAVNAAGSSGPSPASNPVVPLAAQAPGPPLITTVVGRDGQLQTSWSPPVVDGGSTVSGYTLTATTGGVSRNVAVGAPAGMASISGLTNGATYDVTLVATNAIGASESSTGTGVPKAVYAPAPPSGLSAVPDGAGAVTVSWQPPADDGGSVVSGYTVSYQQVAQSGGEWQPVAGAPTHTLAVSGAATTVSASTFEVPAALYLFSITATSTAGTSTPATGQTPVTPVTGMTAAGVVLDPATIAVLTAVTDTSLTWVVPAPAQVAGLTVGQVLVAAPGGLLPGGALRRVTAITSGTGTYQLATQEASLGEAFTNMSVDTSLNPAATPASATAPTAALDQRPVFRASTPGVREVLPLGLGLAAEQSITLAVNLKEGSAFVNAQVNLKSKIELGMNVHNNIVGFPDGVTVDADATVTAAVEGTVGVKGEYTHQIGAIEGVPSVFFIGTVPVVVQPRVPVFLSVTGQVAVGLKASVIVGGGLSWDSRDPGSLKVRNLTQAPHLSAGVVPGVTATGEVTLGVKVQPIASLYGIGGPSLEANAGYKAAINFTPGPGEDFLTVGPEITLKAGLAVNKFGFSASLEQTIGVYRFAGFSIHSPPNAAYTITPAGASVAVGSPLTLAAARSDGVAAPRIWALIGAATGDTISAGGVLTAAVPGGRSVTVTVTDATGAAGQTTITIGARFDPPAQVSAIQHATGTPGASVTWAAPASTGGAPLASYTLITQPSTGTHTLPAGTTTLDLDQLAPGTYAIALYARNTTGQQSAAAQTSIDITPMCSITWAGPDGGSWADPANWTPAHTPGSGDWVCMRYPPATIVTIPAGTSATVAGLNLSDSATLTTNGTLQITSRLTGSASILTGTGTVTIDQGATATFSSAYLRGGVRMVNQGSLTTSEIDVSDGSVLDNQNALTLINDPNKHSAGLYAGNADQVINEAGATLTTTNNTFISAFTNAGTLAIPTGTLNLERTTLTGSAKVVGPGTVNFLIAATIGPSVTFAGSPAVVIGSYATMMVPSTFTFAGIASLTVNGTMSGAGTVTLPTGLATTFSGTLSSGVRVVNKGSLTVSALWFKGGSVLDNQGTLTLAGDAVLATFDGNPANEVINEAGATFTTTAAAEIAAPLSSAGTITIPAGTLSVLGDFNLAGTANTNVTVSGSGSTPTIGQLAVGGAASLAGTLTVSEAAGYIPQIGTTVVVMTATSLTGRFSSVTSPGLSGRAWAATYGPDTVTLTVVPVGAPGSPTGATAIPGDAQAVVSWVAPASEGGSPITGYTITATPGSVSFTTTGATTGTVIGLTNGTAYTFTVTATNAAGTGTVSAPSAPVTPRAVTGVVTRLSDFNRDGFTDLVARNTAGTLSLYPGDGAGGFLSPRQIGTGWNVMTTIVTPGDVTGDGNADILARDTAGVLWLYPGNGASGLNARRQIGSGWNGFTITDAADMNGAGRPDLLARDSAGVLWLYPLSGNAVFGSRIKIGTGWGGSTILGPGDFSGDGRADILARDTTGSLRLYRGNGTGGVAAGTVVGSGWQGMTALVTPGNWDRSGGNDVLGRDTAGRLWFYPGNGTSGFTAPHQIGSGWQGMTYIG